MKIRTTGQLRAFLVQTLQDVREGKVEMSKARNITKLAAQVNASFQEEIRAQRVQLEAGKEVARLGTLQIDGSDDAQT